jgi:hypothetical protein
MLTNGGVASGAIFTIKTGLFADKEREIKLNKHSDALLLLSQHVDFASTAAIWSNPTTKFTPTVCGTSSRLTKRHP